jgi:hypothetical protein
VAELLNVRIYDTIRPVPDLVPLNSKSPFLLLLSAVDAEIVKAVLPDAPALMLGLVVPIPTLPDASMRILSPAEL